MPQRTQDRGSATLLVACLSAGMALTMATGVALMVHRPAGSTQTSAPAAGASAARTVGPSTAPTVRVRARHTGPAVTTAFPHTTEMPTPRHVAVRPRHRVAAAPAPAQVRHEHRVRAAPPAAPHHSPAPRPTRTSCDGWPWGGHWGGHGYGHHSWHHGWQDSRDGCRHD